QLFAIADPKLSRELAISLGGERALIPVAGGLRLYAINGAKLIAELPIEAGGTSRGLFGPNDAIIATMSGAAADAAATIQLWDGATGKPLGQLDEGSRCLGVSRDGKALLTGSRDGIGRVWSFERPTGAVGQSAATPAALLELAKAQVRRCLTREQRAAAFLVPEPPAWCIAQGKWPYQTQAWKDWPRAPREAPDPPLPPWRASASAGRAEPSAPEK